MSEGCGQQTSILPDGAAHNADQFCRPEQKPEQPVTIDLPLPEHYQKNNHGRIRRCQQNMHKLLQEQGCCGYIHALLTL